MTIFGLLDVLRQDARYGWRALARWPAFTVTAVTSLALGIGANAAIFGLVYAVLLEPLPLPRPDRLVAVQRTTDDLRATIGFSSFTMAELTALRQAPGVSLTGQTSAGNLAVEAEGQRDVLRSLDMVDGALFQTLEVQPVVGRMIAADDDREARPVAVISEIHWERWFNRDPSAIGKTIKLHGAAFTVIGVAPRSYQGLVFPGEFSVAVPLGAATLVGQRDIRGQQPGSLMVVGRLRDGTALAPASQAIAAVFDRCCARGELAGDRPESRQGTAKAALVEISHGVPFGKLDVRTLFGRILLVLLASAAIVLLIACANIGSLLLARAAARRRELAVRLSLGASRGRLVRQLLTESAELALLGGVLGLLIAMPLTDLLVSSMPGNFSMVANLLAFRLTPALLVFTLGVSTLCVLVFGLVPALRATRTDLVTSLKDGGDTSGRRTGLLDGSIVAAQVALALLLLSTAGLLGATLRNLRNVDGGFATTNVLLAGVDTRGTSREREGAVPIHEELLSRVRRIGGVRAAGLSMLAPAFGGRGTSVSIEAAGSAAGAGAKDEVSLDPVTQGYFDAAGIRLRSGRDFSPADRAGAPRVAVMSEGLSKRYFAGRDPLGQQIKMNGELITIVGIAADVKFMDLRGDADPMLYVPIAQAANVNWPFVVITARTAGDAPALAAQLRSEIRGVDSDLRVMGPQGIQESLDNALMRERLAASLASAFGALAIGLAAIGLYGVVAYSVARRTTEIGLRMALGARSRDVVWQVLRGSLGLVSIGVLLGAPLTFVAGRAVAAMLFGVGAHDPVLLIAAVLVLLGVALAASAIPAARAARVNPLIALRNG